MSGRYNFLSTQTQTEMIVFVPSNKLDGAESTSHIEVNVSTGANTPQLTQGFDDITPSCLDRYVAVHLCGSAGVKGLHHQSRTPP